MDFQRYRAATSVMEGDHRARQALLTTPIDEQAAKQGFIQASMTNGIPTQ